MGKSTTSPAFKRAFTANTRAAREFAGLTQAQMAQRLGIGGQDDYKGYENSRLLPHRLIPLFCEICGVTPNGLFTGQILC
jgi:transcriptional regulator with XRE-family HTH domain